jgi:hypothetical protein
VKWSISDPELICLDHKKDQLPLFGLDGSVPIDTVRL